MSNESGRALLITSGIGDFIALESVLHTYERQADTIYWATPQATALLPLAKTCFPNLKRTVVLVDDFSMFEFKSFANLDEVRAHLGGSVMNGIDDVNVSRVGAEYLRGERAFQRSTLLHRELADISRFRLPDTYCVIHPYSENRRVPWRDMNAGEWAATKLFLDMYGLPSVVVNRGDEASPLADYDLTNQTTLLEAIEITKHASAFVGCSSVFSVVAGQVVHNGFFVKGHPVLRDEWQAFYYPLQSSCVHEKLHSALWVEEKK